MTATVSTRRVLFVVNDAGFFLSHRLPLAIAARQAGYDVHIAVPQSAEVEGILRHGLSFHAIPLTRSGTHPVREFQAIFALFSLYRALRPDIVHHVTIKPVIYGGIAARLAAVPAVVNAVSGLGYAFIRQGWRADVLRALLSMVYRFALRQRRLRVIFQNPDDQALFVAKGLVALESARLIKGAGVDLSVYALQTEPDQIPLVILPARMLWDKGVSEFVAAATILRREGVKARFALVGPHDPGNRAAVSIEQLELWQAQGDVEWWGTRDDMPAVFAQAHIVCLPSYREGLPKALLEAASCGRAIVTTDTPGCREIVRHGYNGLLVPVKDTLALAAALKRLIENVDERRQMGLRGREMVKQGFSIDRVVTATLDVYNELLTCGG